MISCYCCVCMYVCLVTQYCPTPCDPMDCSLPGVSLLLFQKQAYLINKRSGSIADFCFPWLWVLHCMFYTLICGDIYLKMLVPFHLQLWNFYIEHNGYFSQNLQGWFLTCSLLGRRKKRNCRFFGFYYVWDDIYLLRLKNSLWLYFT